MESLEGKREGCTGRYPSIGLETLGPKTSRLREERERDCPDWPKLCIPSIQLPQLVAITLSAQSSTARPLIHPPEGKGPLLKHAQGEGAAG